MISLDKSVRDAIARRPPLWCDCERNLEEPLVKLVLMLGKFLGYEPKLEHVPYPIDPYLRIWARIELLANEGVLKHHPHPHLLVAIAGIHERSFMYTEDDRRRAVKKLAQWIRSGSWRRNSYTAEDAESDLRELYTKYFLERRTAGVRLEYETVHLDGPCTSCC